jgi:hypothetical protein
VRRLCLAAVQGEGFKILNEGDQVEFEAQSNGEKVSASNVAILQTSVTQAQRDAFAERSNARRVRPLSPIQSRIVGTAIGASVNIFG